MFATHYLEEADVVADRIIVLNHGKVIAEVTRPRSIRERVATRTVRFTLPSESAADLAAIEAVPTVGSVVRVGDQVQIGTTNADTVVRSLVALGLALDDLEVRERRSRMRSLR